MKTQIIQLNRNDDFISVRDKMGWSQTERISLVWPDGDKILDNRLELKLVKRHAEKLGAQLTLITQDNNVQFFARQLGIEVTKSLPSANHVPQQVKIHQDGHLQRNNIRPDLENLHRLIHSPSVTWKENSTIRLVSFGISVLALLVIGIFILPGATVTLYPQISTQSMSFSVTADPAQDDINFTTASLPTEVRQVVVEGRKSMDTTGTILIPDQFAQGILRLMNPADQNIRIPAGAVISSPGVPPIRFMVATTEEIILEPGKAVDLSAQALVPGTSGNLPPDSLTVLEANPGSDLLVTNPEATEGGTDVPVPSPSEQDIGALFEILAEELKQAAITEVQSNLLHNDGLILPGIEVSEVLNQSYSGQVDEPGKQLNLSLRLRIQVQVVTPETLHRLIDPILDAGIKPGYTPVENSLRIKVISKPEFDENGRARWNLQTQRDLQLVIPSELVIQYVRGMPVSEAASLVNHLFPLTQDPQIKVMPGWWPRLPYVAMRIHLVQFESQ